MDEIDQLLLLQKRWTDVQRQLREDRKHAARAKVAMLRLERYGYKMPCGSRQVNHIEDPASRAATQSPICTDSMGHARAEHSTAPTDRRGKMVNELAWISDVRTLPSMLPSGVEIQAPTGRSLQRTASWARRKRNDYRANSNLSVPPGYMPQESTRCNLPPSCRPPHCSVPNYPKASAKATGLDPITRAIFRKRRRPHFPPLVMIVGQMAHERDGNGNHEDSADDQMNSDGSYHDESNLRL